MSKEVSESNDHSELRNRVREIIDDRRDLFDVLA
jgi:hypothetical protein